MNISRSHFIKKARKMELTSLSQRAAIYRYPDEKGDNSETNTVSRERVNKNRNRYAYRTSAHRPA
uniref:Uncharacterized protein n=1 Tax=Oryza barthii TaxID=65489 RepID=A0A0D3FDZ1_9ORYZ